MLAASPHALPGICPQPGRQVEFCRPGAESLPKQPTELDDGLLTASEVAQLKLNADWVVLSACNTAAADKPGAL
jgi:CHAT domain